MWEGEIIVGLVCDLLGICFRKGVRVEKPWSSVAGRINVCFNVAETFQVM